MIILLTELDKFLNWPLMNSISCSLNSLSEIDEECDLLILVLLPLSVLTDAPWMLAFDFSVGHKEMSSERFDLLRDVLLLWVDADLLKLLSNPAVLSSSAAMDFPSAVYTLPERAYSNSCSSSWRTLKGLPILVIFACSVFLLYETFELGCVETPVESVLFELNREFVCEL